jgi:hypothetical protein
MYITHIFGRTLSDMVAHAHSAYHKKNPNAQTLNGAFGLVWYKEQQGSASFSKPDIWPFQCHVN